MIKVEESSAFLNALLAAPRPGGDKILAFYDHRARSICRDARLLLIPLDDHLCHRGDGLFESICYRDGKLFALDAHLERMFDGARALDLPPPLGQDEIKQIACQVARTGGTRDGDLRIFLSRGPGGFGISPAECPAPGLYMVALKAKPPGPEYYARGLAAFTSRFPPKQEYLAKIKSVNYLPNVLMAAEAAARSQDVAITFDEEGHMGEAAIANVAIVDNAGCFRSPAADKILPGTTLMFALALAAEKMPVRSGKIHKAELAAAREALLLTSSSLCVAITSFDGKLLGSGKPGPVSHWLREALQERMQATGTPF